MAKFFQKALRMGEGKKVKQLQEQVGAINVFEEGLLPLSDDELRAKTPALKQRLEDGEELDDILPEAFAVVREVSRRVMGMRHFDVQLMGGIALHQGNIAEMKTGEGKTLVATLPVYLNALSGSSVHLITVNDYMAKLDAEWMKPIYNLLGLAVAILPAPLHPHARLLAYAADVTYCTNS